MAKVQFDPIVLEIQKMLAAGGFYRDKQDGLAGPIYRQSIKDFQRWHGLKVDGDAGPKTLSLLRPVANSVAASKAGHNLGLPGGTDFDVTSANRLAFVMSPLREVLIEARKHIPFTIMASQRGRKAQEAAKRAGNSNAGFGDSAHNWTPAVAVDVAPIPLDWDNAKAFWDVADVIMPIAKQMNVLLTHGGDWDGDGDRHDQKLIDLPHFELGKKAVDGGWRTWAKKAKLFQG